MKKIIFLALATIAMASCTKENEGSLSTPDNEVRITSSIATRTNGNVWESGDEIGVYMTTNGGSFGDLGENILYTTTLSDGNFSSNTPLFYPASGTVDFLAYYPYSDATDFDITAYPVNVAVDQSTTEKQGDVDLMSVTITNQAKTTNAVEMLFDHKLSKISLTIAAKEGAGVLASDLVGIEVTLSGTAATADFDLTSDAINNLGDATNITLLAAADGTSASAIVVPQTLSGATITFKTTADVLYTATLTTDSFEVGKEYNYNVSISNTVVTISSATINGWGDGVEGDSDLNAGVAEEPAEVVAVDYTSIAAVNELLSSSDSELRLSNCYMVNPTENKVCIIPVGSRINTFWSDSEYGNDTTYTIDTDWTTNDTYTIETLWNDFGLEYYTNQITFEKVTGTDDDYAMQIGFADDFSYEGNMVVAVKKDGTIVWSWHIWITDYNPYTKENGTTYDINNMTWMDRNIGARSTAYSYSDGNLYYQWGRKDPLRAIDGDTASALASIADVVKAPDKFYYYSSSASGDWCGSTTSWDQDRDHHWRDAKLPSTQATSGDKYGSTKSIYDPSPLGFMVPGSTSTSTYVSPFSFLEGGASEYTSGYNGCADGYSWEDSSYSIKGDNGILFPAQGSRSANAGSVFYRNQYGNYWSAAPAYTTKSYSMAYMSYAYMISGQSGYRAPGYSVRSIQE
ncbi:MAG: fimbrillin family protein [Rikenellaceae bacterium]